MKLAHLHEAHDPRALLDQVAGELGFRDPGLATADQATVQAAIDLFRSELDGGGTMGMRETLSDIKSAADRGADANALTALGELEHTSFGQLPSVKTFHVALKAIAEAYAQVSESARTCNVVYFLLAAINARCFVQDPKKYTPEEAKYQASIAKAAMKHLGLTPKDL